MAFTVTLDDILSLSADAAVLPLEMTGAPTEGRAAQALAAACGEGLRPAIRQVGFLAVGSAESLDCPERPFPRLIATAVPRWLTGKANELLALHRCYESVYALAEELGCKSLAMPFLSSCYFHFPLEDAVHIALDNGLFARVDIRPEKREADVIPYFEACYRQDNNPLQEPLPEEEIQRLRGIWEAYEL